MATVSVIIPTYNRGHFIERAVRSVLRQTFTDLEVIVVDDSSQDDTATIMTRLCHEDSRVRYIRHETNRGAPAARNTGIRMSQGEYVAFLDSDDEWLPTKLERQIAVFSKGNSRLGVVYVCTQDYCPHLRGNVYRRVLAGTVVPMSPLLVCKSYLNQMGPMDETLPSWQDDDTCVRLARICEFDYVPEPLVVMHMHSGEQISTNPVKLAQGAYAFLNIHGDEIARHCGRRILAKRWVSAGEYVLRAGDHHKASQLFRKAIQVSALSLQALYYAPPALIFPPALLCMFVIKRAIIDYLRKIKKLAVSVI